MKNVVFIVLLIGCFSLNTKAQNVPGFKITDNPTLGKTFTGANDNNGEKSSTGPNKQAKPKYYETVNNIKMKRFKKVRDELVNINKESLDKLSDNSEGKLDLTSEDIEKLEDSMHKNSESINSLNSIIDSLSNEYVKEYLQYRTSTILKFGSQRSRAFFDIIYQNDGEKFKVLNNTGINIGDKTGSIYSELVSGNLSLFRISLGTMVSSSSSDDNSEIKENEAFQRLVTFGGNTVLTLEYPLAYVHKRNNQMNFISRFIAKGAADFPEFGTTTESWAGSATIGINIYADAALTNNQLRFFGSMSINQIYGTNEFRNNLAVGNSSFSFGQLTLGLVLTENIKLSFIVSTFSSEKNLRNKNVIAGGQVLH